MNEAEKAAIKINQKWSTDEHDIKEYSERDAVIIQNAIDDATREKDVEIDRLKKDNKILTLRLRSSLANNLCPDCRDKIAGQSCLRCEVQRLKNKNDQLKREFRGMLETVATMEAGEGVGKTHIIMLSGEEYGELVLLVGVSR